MVFEDVIVVKILFAKKEGSPRTSSPGEPVRPSALTPGDINIGSSNVDGHRIT
jgi:hypothetical protein